MGQKFHSNDDAFQKLQNTIIMYEGEPHYISNAKDFLRVDNQVEVRKLGALGTKLVDYTSDAFDYNNIELGYLTVPGVGAAHVCRRPGRYSFVGIKPENVDSFFDSGTFYGQPMYDCIMGNHPSFRDALKKLQGKITPFHRHAAIYLDDPFNMSIMYMNKRIATVTKDGNVTSLSAFNGDYGKLLKRIGVN